MILPSVLACRPADTPVLVGLSGGADSAALLDMLVRAGVPVSAAHVNHSIRGADADRDAEFCRALAGKYGVPFFLLHADVPAEADAAGEGLEEAARRVRYAFFRRVMEENGIPLLATAHNADDNLETLLFHLVRGSGARGGCGIPPVRQLDPEGKLLCVRPILGMTKAEVLDYCRAHGLEYVTDATNDDVSYARNRLRALVLPELRRINPDAAGAALRFCEALREDENFLASLAAEVPPGEADDAERLAALPVPVRSRVLLRRAAACGARPEYRHLRSLADAAARGSGTVNLPGSVIARVKDGKLTYLRDGRQKKTASPEEIYPSPARAPLHGGENRLPGCTGTVIVNSDPKNCRGIYNLSIINSLNIDTINGELFLRTRQAGDRILCGGKMKNIKKMLSGAHTPLSAAERRRLPVLCDADGIVWVPFLPPRDGSAAGTAAPEKCLAIGFSREET